jgi:hypothetical protein
MINGIIFVVVLVSVILMLKYIASKDTRRAG